MPIGLMVVISRYKRLFVKPLELHENEITHAIRNQWNGSICIIHLNPRRKRNMESPLITVTVQWLVIDNEGMITNSAEILKLDDAICR